MSQPSGFCEDRPQRAHITRITSLTPTDKSSLESHLGKGRIALFLGRSTPWPGAAQTLGLHFLLGTHTCCDSPAGSCRVCGFLLGNSSSSSVSRAAGPTTCKDRGKALTERLSLCHGCPLPFIRGSALLGPSPPACGAADEAARVFARALLCNGMGLHVCACMWLHAGMGPHTRVCCGQTNRCGASGRASLPFCCSRQRLAAILCFLEPLPVAAAALGVSTLLPARRTPVPASHWSAAAPSHLRWPLIGQQQLWPLSVLSLFNGSSVLPLVVSHRSVAASSPSSLSLVSGSSVPPSLASHWSAEALDFLRPLSD